jgi:cob(I)alamin adenosyltransferase
VELWTGKGDDGSTGLYFGGRVRKNSAVVDAYGTIDEAQAFMGLARAEVRGTDIDELLIGLERDLWIVMAELATAPENRHKLEEGKSLTTPAMVERLEQISSELGTKFEIRDFVVPGQDRVSALLDVARTIIRRAERICLAVSVDGSSVVPYLNRLSTVLWAMARWLESGALPTKSKPSAPDAGEKEGSG